MVLWHLRKPCWCGVGVNALVRWGSISASSSFETGDIIEIGLYDPDYSRGLPGLASGTILATFQMFGVWRRCNDVFSIDRPPLKMDGSTYQRHPAKGRPRTILHFGNYHQLSVFSTKGQPLPASLLRMLLVKAGIEQNPGSGSTTWLCSVCKLALRGNMSSVKCNGCDN